MHLPHAPWHAELPAGTDELPPRADVIVVGGGWPALVLAGELVAGGASVIVLEARDRLGSGASARAPGLVAAGLVEHAWRLESTLGLAAVRELYDWSVRGREWLTQHTPVKRGVCWAAVDGREPAELERSLATLERLEQPVSLLTAEQTRERTGGSHFGPSLFSPNDLVLDPVDTTCALAQAAAGASLVCDARVVAAGSNQTGMEITLEDGRTAEAELIVLAGEAGLVDLDPWLSQVLQPVREQAVLLDGPQPEVGVRAGFGYTTYTPSRHGLVVAGCRWATQHMEVGERDDRHVQPVIQERLDASHARFFPARRRVLARWSWLTSTSCDGLPLVGTWPGDSRIALAAGLGGMEATFGVSAALAIAAGLLDQGDEYVPSSLSSLRML